MANQLMQSYGDKRTPGRELRTALIDCVTHDFRTPLTSIKVAVTTLLAGSRVRAAQRNELLSIIYEEAERLNRLVGDAVEASRVDANLNLDLRPHTIAAIVDAAKDGCRSQLGRRPLRVQLQQGLPKVRADLQRAKKALAQLLENATNYSAPDEPITIAAKVSGRFVNISVSDRIDGIDASDQEPILERLNRGREQRYIAQGTGLGLPIANAIIKAHGGTLTVRSHLHHGYIFSFTLPFCLDRSTPHASSQRH